MNYNEQTMAWIMDTVFGCTARHTVTAGRGRGSQSTWAARQDGAKATVGHFIRVMQ